MTAQAGGFSDVPAGHVFADDFAWLAATGITQGRHDGTYGLNNAVTRRAMTAFLNRYDRLIDDETTLMASFDGPVEVVAGSSGLVPVTVTASGNSGRVHGRPVGWSG